jgi:hypothetical protein
MGPGPDCRHAPRTIDRKLHASWSGLPAFQDDIDISRADLDTDAGAAGHFGRDQARARTKKRVIDQLAGPAVVEDRTAHALDWLLRRN